MNVINNLDNTHPLLNEAIKKIESNIIEKHNMPFKIFETSRTKERHSLLLSKGKTRSPVSRHLYNMDNDPILYCTSVDYVHYNGRWSWNIRDSSVRQWYKLFGQLVLDECPELTWGGANRKSTNYNHFELKQIVIVDNLDRYPCVTY